LAPGFPLLKLAKEKASLNPAFSPYARGCKRFFSSHRSIKSTKYFAVTRNFRLTIFSCSGKTQKNKAIIFDLFGTLVDSLFKNMSTFYQR